ncbi:MAG: 23S rRNA (guanosine(2251)-2'-O)-methyltransferase RlmB [Actinomycetota bacterium]|nr:23S rRNA (guanosine(2251)-2'-O)-methyltransferase RlmB [Actinomycetota bacterium]
MTDYLFGRHPVVESLRAGGKIKQIFVAQDSKPSQAIAEIIGLAERSDIPVKRKPRHELDEKVQGNHQGVVAVVEPFSYATLDDAIASGSRIVLLDGLTDPANLGSILRSAEAFGFTALLIPRHRSVSVTPTVRKVASGAAERVAIAEVTSASSAIEKLKKVGFWVIGLHPDAELDYRSTPFKDDAICLVVGAEGAGLSRLVRERCDALVKIPMQGNLASINVAVAAAVVMVEVTRNSG